MIALSRLIACAVLRRIGVGSLIVAEPGRRHRFGTGHPAAVVDLHDPRVWRMVLLRGCSRACRRLRARHVGLPDLVALIRLGALNAARLDRVRTRLAPLSMPARMIRVILRRSTRGGGAATSPRITTSAPTCSSACSIRRSATPARCSSTTTQTLEEAQIAKLERVCEKLDLGAG